MVERNASGTRHIHLDPLGGIAGDIFVAAILDAFPELETIVRTCIDRLDLGSDASFRLEHHNDGMLIGRRFIVGTPTAVSAPANDGPYVHYHAHPADGDVYAHLPESRAVSRSGSPESSASNQEQSHRCWRDIRRLLEVSRLSREVKQHAIAIFRLLAEVEGRVHGVPEEEVTFHEIGSVDSICDVVAASVLIDALKADWSIAPLPLGSGRVPTAHGLLPVPAPATALLLMGLPTVDDGLPGERVTPTGAAIVKYLRCEHRFRSLPRILQRTGIGFGLRNIPGISNCLRVMVSQVADHPAPHSAHRELAVIEFEVDDQAAEDLSLGLDRIRALHGIHDVIQIVGVGKKGRTVVHIQILASPAILDQAIDACFDETTTIGLRYHIINGTSLFRKMETVEVDGRRIRVKCVNRPGGGQTAKAEIDDVADEANSSARTRLRACAERLALNKQEALPRKSTAPLAVRPGEQSD